jgi:hypothetical protein
MHNTLTVLGSSSVCLLRKLILSMPTNSMICEETNNGWILVKGWLNCSPMLDLSHVG